jgi:hypothetical protein
MMPMKMRRKVCNIEKVENLYRTATAQKILPTRWNKSDHACAMRSSVADTINAARCHATMSGGTTVIDDVNGERASAQPGRSYYLCVRSALRPDHALPDMSHFAAEFYECCANPAARFWRSRKFARQRPSFLRCSGTRFRVVRSH